MMVLGVLAAWSAFAVEPSATRDALGTRIVTVALDATGFLDLLALQMVENAAPARGMPEDWGPLLRQAAKDELAHDKATIYAIVGRQLATKLTDAQLAIGAELLQDPRVVAVFTASATGTAPPALDQTQAKEVAKKLTTPDASSFLAALAVASRDFSAGIDETLIREFMPGFFRRFGEAAERAEASR